MREGEGPEEDNAPGSGEDTTQQELDAILEQGLLNSTDNQDKIKKAFNLGPGTVKICVSISFEINCTNQEEDDGCFNCSGGNPYTFIWTSFDPTTFLTGPLLLLYGTASFDIFGFEWGGACDLSDEGTVSLLISLPSLALLCGLEDRQLYISASLNNLTIKV